VEEEAGTIESEFPAEHASSPPGCNWYSVGVEVNDMGFSYAGQANGTCLLDGIGFSSELGSFVSLIGPSGAGGRTLADLILGLHILEPGQAPVGDRVPIDQRKPRPGSVRYVP